MTKADIIDYVFANTKGVAKKEIARLVDLIFENLKQALADGERVKIVGFGTFTVRSKGARPGRNPKTREPITIAPRRVVSFKASQVLKERLNAESLVE